MTRLSLKAVRARVDAALSAPWVVHESTEVECEDGVVTHKQRHRVMGDPGQCVALLNTKCHLVPNPEENATFIAAARTDVPALLDALTATREVLEWLLVEGMPDVHNKFTDMCRAALALVDE